MCGGGVGEADNDILQNDGANLAICRPPPPCSAVEGNMVKYAKKMHCSYIIQGVQRNMTVARQLESSPSTFNLFVTFSRQPTFTFKIRETMTKIFC